MSEPFNLNLFRTFLTLCETGSFSACARKLKLSQPSISRQIRELEEQLQIQLFLRDRAKVRITQEGVRLRQEITPLLDGMEGAIRSRMERPSGFSGILRFASLAEVGQSTFMGLLLKFREEHPEMSLDVRYSDEGSIREWLRNGSIDFGILPEEAGLENLKLFRLMNERITLVTRASNLEPPWNKKSAAFVAHNASDPLFEEFQRRFPKLIRSSANSTRIYVNSHRSMIEALLSTDCFAVMPLLSAKASIDAGEIRVVPGYERTKSLYLAHFDNPHLSERDRALRHFLVQECKKLGRT